MITFSAKSGQTPKCSTKGRYKAESQQNTQYSTEFLSTGRFAIQPVSRGDVLALGTSKFFAGA